MPGNSHIFVQQVSRLGSIGLRTLRDTAATEMLRNGVHPKVVADRLGHSSTRMTLEVYSRVVPALEARAAQTVKAALERVLGRHLVNLGVRSHQIVPKKNAAIPCGVSHSAGGHERSRTSDP